MKTIGPYSNKLYRCSNCQHEYTIGTNHWGETYGSCPNCAWKNPGRIFPQVCMEPVPEGYTAPEPWKIVKLKDVAEMIECGT